MPVNTISSSFYSLRYYQIIYFYDKYSVFIDFAIFLMIFTGLIKTVFHNHWQEGAGKKALITGLSAALSLSLVLTKDKIGFSIQSFGPLAAGIIFILIGFGVYKMFRGLNLNVGSSISLSAVLIYFSLISITPQIFENGLFKPYIDFIDIIIAIGVIYCIYAISTKVFGNIYNNDKQFQKLPEDSFQNKTDKISVDENDAFISEKKFMKKNIKSEIKKEIKDVRYILKDLFKIRRLLKKNRYSNDDINKLLNDIIKYKNDLEKHNESLIKNIKALGSFDFELYKMYDNRIKKLTVQESLILEKRMSAEYKKYCDETKIIELENNIQNFKNQFLFELNESVSDLKNNKNVSGLAKLENAIRYLLEMHSIEKKVYQIYKQIYKINLSEMD